MRGLFCTFPAKNDEEFRAVVRTRMRVMAVFFLLGAATLTVTLLAKFRWTVAVSEHMLGVFSGIGSGLIVVSAIRWLQNRRILSDEKRLREERRKSTDERLIAISHKAFRTAAAALVAALYIALLVAGMFYPVLFSILALLVFVFFVTYVICYYVFEKRM